ncbi:ribosomal RNA small subunit methyltransferase A [Candidatus Saccharibacteria bacterium]|nr:ribosomal RNA small subunit methyltransferase A [Candidatus Saccharibacteria bacterium]
MTETKKELGQHWLHDDSILQAIVEAGEVTVSDYVLEVGPGKGTLTKKLIDANAEILALEFDKDLIPALHAKFANCKNLAISDGDIRTFNFSDLPKGYKIVANIPYYLTSHLIRSISETSNPPALAVLLIQKEVAERLCAHPGQMSILAVTAQFYFECSLDIEVPARFFTPPPKVDSQVVVLRRRPGNPFDVVEKDFFRLVKAGFSEKRKNLRNALSGGLQLEKNEAERLLYDAGITPTRRAQELSLDEWNSLYLAYNQ